MTSATSPEAPPLVVVTGGRSGIRTAAVTALAEAGFRPLTLDIAADGPGADLPAIHWPDPVDVSDEVAVTQGVEAIERVHGPIAGLVNAAGILGRMHPPERLRMEHWDREIAVDLRGTFLMCRAVGPRMAARRSGSIVNVASVVGVTSAPVHGYGPAKAAVINLTMTLAAEWGSAGVRVNAVSPGFTRTPALEAGIQHGVLRGGGADPRRRAPPARRAARGRARHRLADRPRRQRYHGRQHPRRRWLPGGHNLGGLRRPERP